MIEADCAGCTPRAFIVADVSLLLIIEWLVAFLTVVAVLHMLGIGRWVLVFVVRGIVG